MIITRWIFSRKKELFLSNLSTFSTSSRTHQAISNDIVNLPFKFNIKRPLSYDFYCIENPYRNLETIKKLTKGQKGFYTIEKERFIYCRATTSLYSKISVHFLPSLQLPNIIEMRVKKKMEENLDIGIYRNYDFTTSDTILTLWIYKLEQPELEIPVSFRHFVDIVQHNITDKWTEGYRSSWTTLNITGFELAGTLVFNRTYDIISKGKAVYVYDSHQRNLIHLSESIETLSKDTNIPLNTLLSYYDSDQLFLNRYFLTSYPLTQFYVKSTIVNKSTLKRLISEFHNKEDKS